MGLINRVLKHPKLRKIGAGLATALSIYTSAGGLTGCGGELEKRDFNSGEISKTKYETIVYQDKTNYENNSNGFDIEYNKPINEFAKNYAETEYLVVSAKEFEKSGALRELIDYRSRELSSESANIENIFAQYPESSTDPVGALDKFVEDVYVSGKGKLKYLFLIGNKTQIPAKYFEVGTLEKGFSDGVYADFSFLKFDALTPELAVGRAPVENKTELEHVVNKIISFEESNSWENNKNVLVGGPSWGWKFEDGLELSEVLDKFVVPVIPENVEVQKFYENDKVANRTYSQELTDNLIESINSGVFSVGYSGHGEIDRWYNTNFDETNFSLDRIGNIKNYIYPVIYASACLTANYTDNNSESIGEELVNNRNGAVAYVGSSAITGNVNDFSEAFYNNLFNKQESERIGDVFLNAKRDAYEVDPASQAFLNKEMNLLGDPALRVKGKKN